MSFNDILLSEITHNNSKILVNSIAKESLQTIINYYQWVDITQCFMSSDDYWAQQEVGKEKATLGYNLHNYGLAIDISRCNEKRYTEFKDGIRQYGWYCKRRDNARGPGDNHFNFLGSNASKYLIKQDLDSIEYSRIDDLFGSIKDMDHWGIDTCLVSMKFIYDINKITPLSKAAAVRRFQGAWGFPTSGILDLSTIRAIQYLNTKIKIK